MRDHGTLYLRTATVLAAEAGPVRVILSEPLDKEFVDKIAGDLGRIAIYGNESATASSSAPAQQNPSEPFLAFDEGKQRQQVFSAGTIPPASNTLDRQIGFPIPLQVVDWATGERQRDGALAEVETRPSVLYARLFAALGDYAKGLEYILLSIMFVFAIIWLLALFVGTKLARTITSAVDQLYEGTKHVNRADFSHRITVQSSDQLATLANSFNSMTTSIEKLVQEQKEKQRLEGELAIAQEVQAQLYPKLITQLETLEVHGFCRPARTVSGDYYDFLALNSDRLVLAVGDVSGKGISAALLMATIYAAVRAYSIEDRSLLRELTLREAATVGAAGGSGLMLASDSGGTEASPATLLTLLNHQLYESTPAAKYATLFLGTYDGATRRLTYTNGGHLPPILISEDGSSQLLSCGGTVVGLFDNLSFPEATVQLRPGDVLVAYSGWGDRTGKRLWRVRRGAADPTGARESSFAAGAHHRNSHHRRGRLDRRQRTARRRNTGSGASEVGRAVASVVHAAVAQLAKIANVWVPPSPGLGNHEARRKFGTVLKVCCPNPMTS